MGKASGIRFDVNFKGDKYKKERRGFMGLGEGDHRKFTVKYAYYYQQQNSRTLYILEYKGVSYC